MNRIKWLKDTLNFDPKLIIDVGANRGEWSRQIKQLFPNCDIKLFEANPYCKQFLTEFNDVTICLVGDENKNDIPFFLNPNNLVCTGSSMMKELSVHYKHAIEIKLNMKRLDTILNNNQKIDFLKIDVQGAELLVLKGSGNLINDIDFILLETNVLQYNENSPMFYDVLKYMNDQNN